MTSNGGAPDRAGAPGPSDAVRGNEQDALGMIRRASLLAEHGLYLGEGTRGPVWARPEQAVLVLGPPRSGKTTSLVIPSVLAAHGPVVSTSTKPDVLVATTTARRRSGPCFVYDPSGTVTPPSGVERARWSPVTRCTEWDEALLLASRLVGAVRPAGHTQREGGFDHWTERAQALLAPVLHAAALGDVDMAGVLRWVDRREASYALAILRDGGNEKATDLLAGIAATDPRELSSIWSTASGVLSAYRSKAALDTTVAPNIDAADFCRSAATIYVCAAGSRQALAAPLVVGLLSEIRDAAYARSALTAGSARSADKGSGRTAPLVMALDEVANIAPLPDLPGMVSEGGSQGVTTLACLQDLSQARARWGDRADGFLSLFGTTVVLRGIGDVRTLRAISTLAGEHEVRTRSISTPVPAPHRGLAGAAVRRLVLGPRARAPDRTPTLTTSSAQRPRLAPDVIARGMQGHGLMLDEGNKASWVALARCHESWPWCAALSREPERVPARSCSREPDEDRELGGGRGLEAPSGREPPGRGTAGGLELEP